ncbi:HTH-type transcriptional repressor YvoA [compost metagenome]
MIKNPHHPQLAHGASLLGDDANKRYVTLAHILRLRIRTGEYPPGARLPSIADLAKQFDVAVVTARQALALLEQDGLVQRRQGVGTFVLDDAMAPKGLRLPLDQDWSGIRALWQTSETRILAESERVQCPFEPGEPGIPAEHYFYMRRIHYSSGIPYTVADIYIDRQIYELAPRRFRQEIALHLLRKLLPDAALRAHEAIQVDAADVQLAKHLEIAVGAPVVVMKRVVRDQDNRILYSGRPIYRGDIVRLDRSFDL